MARKKFRQQTFCLTEPEPLCQCKNYNKINIRDITEK